MYNNNMMETGPISKETLRRFFRERRISLTGDDRVSAVAALEHRLSALTAFREAAGIAAYWALADEIDLGDFILHSITSGKRLFLPRANKDEQRLEFSPFSGDPGELRPGPFGLLEPDGVEVSSAEIDIVVVPGLAFDLHRHRLGYGAGYYDRFLKNFQGISVGVAFDAQTIDILPIAEHDVALDMVVTESRTF